MNSHVHDDKHSSLLDFATHHRAELGLRPRVFKKGEVLLFPHSDTNSVFIVRSGRLRVSAPAESGQVVFLAELGEGDVVGEVSAISGSRQATVVEAVIDSETYVISRAAFLRVLRECPEGALELMKVLCTRLKELNRRHVEKVSLTMPERLAAEIKRLMPVGEESGSMIVQAPTHAELADRIGSHREAVTKELRRLSREGTVRVKRGFIEILRPEKLIG